MLAYRVCERNSRAELERLSTQLDGVLPPDGRMQFAVFIAPFQAWQGDEDSGAHYLKVESCGVAVVPQKAWRIGAATTQAIALSLDALPKSNETGVSDAA